MIMKAKVLQGWHLGAARRLDPAAEEGVPGIRDFECEQCLEGFKQEIGFELENEVWCSRCYKIDLEVLLRRGHAHHQWVKSAGAACGCAGCSTQARCEGEQCLGFQAKEANGQLFWRQTRT